MSLQLAASFNESHDKVMTYANKVNYPFLMVLGDKDVIVSNAANREWYSKVSTIAS